MLVYRLALVLAPLPLLVTFLIQLWSQRPHYQFVPVYLAALIGLCWTRRPTEALFPGNPSVWQRVFLCAGFTFLIPAALLFSPWLGIIAWLLLLPGACLDLLPRPVIQRLTPVWTISWFMVPPPFQWDVDLLQWLRAQTSHATGVVLDALGVIHIQAGNTFEVPGQQFFVEDACSGIHSLLSIVGVALLWAVYVRSPWPATVLSAASAAAAAIALNIVRVLVIVLTYARWQLDLSTGWQHETLGLALFGVALGFLISIQNFWQFWFTPLNLPARKRSGPPTNTTTSTRNVNSIVVNSGRRKTWLKWAAAASVMLLIPQFAHSARLLLAAPALHASLTPRQAAMAVDQPDLPSELRGWKQTDFKPLVRDRHHAEGEFSRQWTYRAPWGVVQLSFDFPFEGAHPLLRCYQSTGWTPAVERTVAISDPSGGYQHVALKRREFEVGTMIYSLWDGQGTLVTPQAGADPNAQPKPFLVRLRDRVTPAVTSPVIALPTTYQFQVLATGEFPLGESEQAELLQFFLEARDLLRQRFAADAPVETDSSPVRSNAS